MTVHVIIKRKYKVNQPEKILPLMEALREKARAQEGYIEADTLQSTEDTGDFLVISKWESADHWQKWFASKERRELQGKIDSLIGERTFYEIFKPC